MSSPTPPADTPDLPPSPITPPVAPPPSAASALVTPPPIAALTPEEQMALFEKELKETDWGHQPC